MHNTIQKIWASAVKDEPYTTVINFVSSTPYGVMEHVNIRLHSEVRIAINTWKAFRTRRGRVSCASSDIQSPDVVAP